MTPNPKPKILWVDDVFAHELNVLISYEDELIHSGGFEIVKILHPDKALDILERGEEEFACIILDIMMPYGKRFTAEETEGGTKTGIVLAKRIRWMDKYKAVPIVLLTGARALAEIQNEFPCFLIADISAEGLLTAIQSEIKKAKLFPRSNIERTDIFISYCHKDKAFLDELKVFLKPLERNGTIVYDDTKIRPGAEWKAEIKNALNKTKVAILLVSPDFLASDSVMNKEVPALLKAAETEDMRIIWIPLSKCLYEVTPIADYQAACDPASPVDGMTKSERNKVFTKVCKDIVSIMGISAVLPRPHLRIDANHKAIVTPALIEVYFDGKAGFTDHEKELFLRYIERVYQEHCQDNTKRLEIIKGDTSVYAGEVVNVR